MRLETLLKYLNDATTIMSNPEKMDAYGEILYDHLSQADNLILEQISCQIKEDLGLHKLGVCAFTTKVMLTRTLQDIVLVIERAKGSSVNIDNFKEMFKEAIDEFDPKFPKAGWSFAEHRRKEKAEAETTSKKNDKKDDDAPCECPVCVLVRRLD